MGAQDHAFLPLSQVMASDKLVCGECQERGNEQRLTGAEQPGIKETVGFGRGSSGKWPQHCFFQLLPGWEDRPQIQ